MHLSKSFVANFLAFLVTIIGYFYSEPLFTAGLFGLSGGITNWLAIHMLFERVPGLYGSGIIPRNFNTFKAALRDMMMEQFFSNDTVQKMAAQQLPGKASIQEKIDLDKIFDGLMVAVQQSSLGNMLNMVGGIAALEPMRESVNAKLTVIINEVLDDLEQEKQQSVEKIPLAISGLIDKRLAELTPQLVKDLVYQLIHQHLGWLVVWGVIFGGVIGAIFSLS